MNGILAIDSGGTKCAALLITMDGEVLGRGYCHGTSVKITSGFGGRGRSPEALVTAARQALTETPFDTLHMALINTRLLPRQLSASIKAKRIKLLDVSESDAAYAMANEKTGIVALSGTGAFVHGVSSAGCAIRLDGLGPMLGDYGSAHYIGRQGLKAAAMADWSPRHHSVLRERVCNACGIPPRAHVYTALIRYAHGYRDRSEIAALAKVVDDAAVEGDAVARRIMHESATMLGETVRDVVASLDMGRDPYAMIGIGSVIMKSRLFWPILSDFVRGFAPNLHPVLPRAPAVAGMAIYALEQINEPGGAAAATRLRDFDWGT